MEATTRSALRHLLPAVLGALVLGAPVAAMATTAVTVTVVNGAIVLNPDPLVVGSDHNLTLTWTLATPGWTFTQDGIHVDDDADGEFGAPQQSADHRRITDTDKDDDVKDYKYEVSVTNGTDVVTIDPTIHNGGH